MKKKLLLALLLTVLMIVAVLPAAVFAAEKDFLFDSSTGTIRGYTGTADDVVIPAKIGSVAVTAINTNAFANNLSLTSVTIPSGVTSIGMSAFMGCKNLASVTVLATEPPSVGNKAFLRISSQATLTVHTPTDCVEKYKNNSGWKNDFQNIVAAEHDTDGTDGACSVCGYKEAVQLADYSEVEAALAAAAAKNEADYTADSWAALQTAIEAVKTGYTIDKHDEVDKMAADINDAIAALVPIFEFDKTTGTIIKYTGDLDAECVEIPATIGGVAVTAIGDDAFSAVDDDRINTITSVTIPAGVTSIGNKAFSWCESLTSVTIPSTVTSIGESAFYACTGLTSVTIPSTVTSISDWAFSGCKSLTSVTIPEGVESIGNSAFSGCTSLASVTIPSGVTSIGESAFSQTGLSSVTIPEGVTSIGMGAFYECTSLASVTIPEGVTSIGNYAFQKCTSLASVTIPEGVTSIGDYAFAYCTGLSSVTIPESVESIGESAFKGCTGLSSVTIPEGVTSIGVYAFYETGLTDVTIPSTVTSIGESTFEECTSLASVTISSGVESIGDWAFSGCTSLTSVTILEGVESIGESAFAYCTGLSSVTIPEGVESIGAFAFYETGLTDVTIPSTVTFIDYEAFYKCSSLASVTVLATTPPTLDDDVFSEIATSPTLYVHTSTDCVDAYKNGDWSSYFPTIVASDKNTGTITKYNGTSVDVVIPAKIGGVDVKAIGANAFKDNKTLETVTIPEGVTSIGDYAFNGCTSLASVTVLATTPPTLVKSGSVNNNFDGIAANPTLYVHTSTDCLAAYQNSDWKTYFTTIEAAEHDTNGTGGACSVCGYKAEPADYTAVNTAKDRFAAINTASYTEASVKAVEDAIEAVVEGKKIDEQDVVDGFAQAINDAIDALVPYVAAINETTPYPTLAAAVAAAKSGDTIVLLENVEISSTIVIDESSVTFDGNGKTISTASDNLVMMELRGDASTVRNLTLDGTGKTYVVGLKEYAGSHTYQDVVTQNLNIALWSEEVKEGDNRIFENCDLCGSWAGLLYSNPTVVWDNLGLISITTNWAAEGGNVVLKQSTITGYNVFMVDTVFEECTFTVGGTSINDIPYTHAGGKTLVKDCVFDEAWTSTSSCLAAFTGAVLTLENPTFEDESKNLIDFLFISENRYAIVDPATDESGKYTAGTVYLFSKTGPEYLADVLAEGYGLELVAVTKDGYTQQYEIRKNPVAKIGETRYATLEEAVAAAKSGDTITLLADSDESFTLPVGVTFDTNGKEYTGTVSAPENYEVVTAEGVYTVCNHTYGMWVSKDADTHSHSRTCDQCREVKTADHNWNAPSFLWSFTANGGVTATYRTTCSVCGYTSTETAATITSDEKDENVVWTATVIMGEETYTETKTAAKTYTVTVPEGFTGGGSYEYGTTVTVKPNRSGHYNFSLNGALSAINATSLTFKVTGNMTVTTEAYEAAEEKPVLTMTSGSNEYSPGADGKYKVSFKINWAIEKNSGIKVVEVGYIYRYGGTNGATINTATVLEKGSVKKSSLTSLNGSYQCSHSYSSSYAGRNVYAVGYMTYTQNGETKTIYTDEISTNEAGCKVSLLSQNN